MKGLFSKDFYINKRQYVLLSVFAIIYLGIGIFSENNALMTIYVILLGAITVLSCFAYDDQAKWDTYATTLPVSGQKIVLSRYLHSITICVVSIIAMIVFSLVSSMINSVAFTFSNSIQPSLIAFGGILVYQSVVLPLIYKFGSEKGRYLMLAVIMIPSIIVILLNKATNFLNLLNEENAMVPLASLLTFLPVIGLVLFFFSYLISVKIYNSKDR